MQCFKFVKFCASGMCADVLEMAFGEASIYF
jgi:hypothetical protein